MAPRILPSLIRFGVFEVDTKARELRKHGRRIKLQDLPFQFLLVLLETPGQLITRDELAGRLWPGNALIDIDNGLNTAAKKLRVALSDDAESPRFVETLPKRGYRFIGVVQSVPRPEAEQPPQTAAVLETPEFSVVPGPAAEAAPAPTRGSAGRWIWALAICLALSVAAFLLTPTAPRVMVRALQLTHTGRIEPYATIVTDGSRIYFLGRTGGQRNIGQVSVEGGTPTPVSTPAGSPDLCDISPKRTELLVSIGVHNEEDAPLWILPTVSGSPRRLGNLLGHAATWSRDGRSIVYGFGKALYRVGLDGQDSRKIADVQGSAYFLRWTPQGQPERLRFMVFDKEYSIWECYPDGSGLRPFAPAAGVALAPGSLGTRSAGWTPDGKYFLFQTLNPTAIWAYRESRNLTHPFDKGVFQIYATPADTMAVTASVDGKRIFFAAGKESRELVSFDLKRGVFLPYFSGSAIRDLAFSKDGQWLAYQTIPEGTLWRSHADGSQRAQLSSALIAAQSPRWSPDGQHVAFEQYASGTSRIYVVPFDGGSIEQIPTFQNRGAGSPSWSPDGQSIMFGCYDRDFRQGLHEICMCDLKTRQSRVLPGTEGLLRPTWSPDAKYVAALVPGGTAVFLYDLATGKRTLVAGDGNFSLPYWTRDSRYVYFQQVLGDVDQPIFRCNRATHEVERMMSSRQLPQSSFSGYTLTGLTPDDQPIATVLRSNGDLYSLDVDLP